eukprot:TRINITY_DN9204_c0_g1_i2.p1 TRINITY_DN9204_c0_g1~~TRINITY_DN9204_c0_g1_i2.p1  ORF type:complete len:602 (-),score=87.15 TRINITY_DN9204_c0_g1_i2:249-2054(-)
MSPAAGSGLATGKAEPSHSSGLASAGRHVGKTGPTRRPKWRLCFRLDRRTSSAKDTVEDLPWKHQHDFFVTVIDPPATAPFVDHAPAPFFASRAACHVADLFASRPMLTQLSGHSFQGKAVAALGRECMTAGLVSAMLGANVVFVSEQAAVKYVEDNVRMFKKDVLDYTKTKSATLAAVPSKEGRSRVLEAAFLCEKIRVPSLDVVVLTECSFERLVGDFGGINGFRKDASTRGSSPPSFWGYLAEIVPKGSSTRVLVICDRSALELTRGALNRHSEALTGESSISVPSWLQGEGLPPGLVLPDEWYARPFCQLPQQVPVIWLERSDAEARSVRKATPASFRQPLPPMGASSSRCGCGGNIQSPLIGKRIENEQWFVNNGKLKDAISLHNQLLQAEAGKVLEEARAWASSATSMHLSGFVEGLGLEHGVVVPSADSGLDQETEASGNRPWSTPSASGPGPGIARPWAQPERAAACPPSKNSGPLSRSDGFNSYVSKASRRQVLPPFAAPKSARGGAAAARQRTSSRKALGSRQDHGDGSQTAREPAIAEQPENAPSLNSSIDGRGIHGGRTARVPTIAERHASPPYWYQCNRPVYGSNRSQ